MTYTEDELRQLSWELIQPALRGLDAMADEMTPVIMSCEDAEDVHLTLQLMSRHITNLLIDGEPECDPSQN